MENEFLKKLGEIIKRDQEINPDDKFREYEEWDSLNYLSVISLIDDEYDLIIPQEEFKKFSTVKDILNYIQKERG